MIFTVGDGPAIIGKGQGYSAFAGQKAVYFHYRYEGGKPVPIFCDKVEGLVVIGFTQYFGPGRGLEKDALIAGQEQVVPVVVLNRIYYFYIQFT